MVELFLICWLIFGFFGLLASMYFKQSFESVSSVLLLILLGPLSIVFVVKSRIEEIESLQQKQR